MKPHKYIRKGEGYCCEWDDGPFKKWVKRNRRTLKRSDKNQAKKELTTSFDDEKIYKR